MPTWTSTTIGRVISRVALQPITPGERGSRGYHDPFGNGAAVWDYTRWTGEEIEIGFPAAELVPSWTARTPPGSWLEVELRARTADGRRTRWYVLGRWAETCADIHRTSLPGQGDEDGDVAVDTLVARRPMLAYQVRVTLYGTGASVGSVSVMASAAPGPVRATPPGKASGIELAVPPLSQRVHAGHYPQWDGGGGSWCSPSSVAMVLGFWGRGPAAEELAWVDPADPCPAVDHAARDMYDHSYQGCGNWPFSVAYAGRYGLTGFVTRLRSLTELESFVAAGIPLITSQSFKERELPGAGYSTTGHIMVVAGFTAQGDVIANDPAAEGVRRIYPRAAFENVWLRGSGSGGVVYVLHPPEIPLPPSDGNW
ncbi:peptidase C39 family protein [Nonomuraea africana]